MNSASSSHGQKLRSLLSDLEQSPLFREVCAYIVDRYSTNDDIEGFIFDLAQHGCVCGMVSSLVYYTDTHAFFDRHYQEIEDLRQQTEDDLGEPLKIKGDLRNFFAWFAFEETALGIARDYLQLDL